MIHRPATGTMQILLLGLCLLPASPGWAQKISQSNQIWSADVIRASGQPVIPLFDGWFPNGDGSRSLCFSYFNMNTEQALDIPLGENNHLSDTRFTALLPTHFDPLPPEYRHRFCAFTVRVPADFRRDEKIIWTLGSAGETLSVPGHILPAFILDEPKSDGRGDVAPMVKLAFDGEAVQGRVGIHSSAATLARAGVPVTLKAWITHPDGRVWVGWTKHSGPGDVSFNNAEYEMSLGSSPATVTANFATPGEYVINMQTIDDTAAFEFYCCHTNAYINVTVSP